MKLNNSARFPHLLDAGILRDIPKDDKTRFIDSCKIRTFKSKSIVLRQGELTDYTFMVVKGRIEISYISETGNHSIIYHAFPGNILGAVETLSSRPCAGTCTALTDTTTLVCRRSDLFEKMKSPIFLRNFAEDLHDVLLHDNLFKSVDQFLSAEQKICVYLDKLASNESVFMESQSYLADVVGCSRQTVNKELGRLREQGIVEITKLGISILDRRALAQRKLELESPHKKSQAG